MSGSAGEEAISQKVYSDAKSNLKGLQGKLRNHLPKPLAKNATDEEIALAAVHASIDELLNGNPFHWGSFDPENEVSGIRAATEARNRDNALAAIAWLDQSSPLREHLPDSFRNTKAVKFIDAAISDNPNIGDALKIFEQVILTAERAKLNKGMQEQFKGDNALLSALYDRVNIAMVTMNDSLKAGVPAIPPRP